MVRYNRKEHQILIGALFVCDKICTINTNKQVRKKSRKEGETTLDKKHKWIESSKAVLFLAMTATFLWGSAVPCIKIGYRFFGIESGDTGAQMLFAGYRFLFAGIAILMVISIQDRRICIPNGTEWRKLFLLGFVQTFLQYFFYYIGMAHVTGVKGSIMNASSTLLCVLVAHFYYRNDRLSLNQPDKR